MDISNHVECKHGHKARLVTPEVEAALDAIAADRFEDPIVQVDLLNDSFGNIAYVWTTNGEDRQVSFLIAPDGSTVKIA